MPQLIARKPCFVFEREIGDVWHPKGEFATAYADGVSLVIPGGELFFIRTVSEAEKLVLDPELGEEIKIFLIQEGRHTYWHKKYNELLKNKRKGTYLIEKGMAALIDKWNSKELQTRLAYVVYLEHFTAVFSYGQLKYKPTSEVMRLWQWHCTEEVEHRSTAWRIYQHLGYSKYKLKRDYFKFALRQMFVLLEVASIANKTPFSVFDRVKCMWHVFNPINGAFPTAIFSLCIFMLPGFNPDQHK